jgi:HlyD family secretion protein
MKKWRWLIIVVVVAAVAAGGYFYLQRNRAKASSQTQYQTAQVARGNLVVTVLGSGTIQARKQLDLAFGIAGRVKTLNVQEGDTIKAGQQLIALDTSDLEANLAKARLNVATAKVQLKKVQTGSTAAEVAAAQAQVKSAEENLARVKAGPTAADLAAAESAVATAQQSLKTLTSGPTADDLQRAKMKVDQAKNSLFASQSSRDATKGNPNASGASKNSAEAGVLNAELNVQLAEMDLQKLQERPKAADVQDAKAKVAQAQETLDKLKASPTAADVAAAEAQLAQAQSSLANVTTGPTQDDIDIAQAQVDLAVVAQEQAQKQLDDAVLTAPYDGVVLSLNVSLGDWVSDTAVVAVVADMANLEIEAPLSELDVARVEQGQQATVDIGALTETRLPAHVERVALAAQISQGVANYPALIVLDKTDPKVRSGMSANVTIIADRRNDVLLAPNRAVRTQGADRVVATLENGQIKWLTIKIGASNDTQTEVVEGLQEGQSVVTNPPNLPRQGRGGFGGGGPVFVGPGGRD